MAPPICPPPIKPIVQLKISLLKVRSSKSGKISGAGLDTLANEAEFFGKEHVKESDLPDDYKELVNMDNVLITPHVAFFTKLAVKNSIEIALNDMKSIINGKGSKNIVNL